MTARGDLLSNDGRGHPIPATFSASPVAVDGKILITSEEGDTFVVRAGRQHEFWRQTQLESRSMPRWRSHKGRFWCEEKRRCIASGKMIL